MKDPFKTLTGVSLAGVLALVALYGKPFLEAAMAAWLFLLQITKTAPLGLASFFAALSMATMLDLALERWVPLSINPNARRAAIEMIVLLSAIALSWLQLHQLNGILFGVLAGLAAPLLARFLMALSSYIAHVAAKD